MMMSAIGSASVAGQKRSKSMIASDGLIVGNEDRVAVDEEHKLAAVIDGHGGSLCAEYLVTHALGALRNALGSRGLFDMPAHRDGPGSAAGSEAGARAGEGEGEGDGHSGDGHSGDGHSGDGESESAGQREDADDDDDDDGLSAADSEAHEAPIDPASLLEGGGDLALMPLVEEAFHEAFAQLEAEFKDVATKTGDTSGACAMMMVVLGDACFVGHCGDCRAVLRDLRTKPRRSKSLPLRRRSRPVVQLTHDHRVQEPGPELERVLRAGGLVARGRICNLTPSRVVGDWDVKSTVGPGVVIAEPEVSAFRIMSPCVLVLASDGVWDSVSNKKAANLVEKFLRTKPASLDDAARHLATTARASVSDDVSAIIITWR